MGLGLATLCWRSDIPSKVEEGSLYDYEAIMTMIQKGWDGCSLVSNPRANTRESQ